MRLVKMVAVLLVATTAGAQTPWQGPSPPVLDAPAPTGAAWTADALVAPLQALPEIRCPPADSFKYCYSVLARAFYMNDQRIEWSGQEATFAVEGALQGSIVHQIGEWKTSVTGQLFLNQPYDRNMLIAPAERTSYLGNFQIDPVEISQLYLCMRRADFVMSIGKLETPFGRYWAPLNTNQLIDAPFIRSEVINWRETGFLLQYDPDPFVFTVGLVNGSEDGDTNSSKAIITRIGYECEGLVLGMSLKWHDGFGSEEQKTVSNYFGIDCRYRWGRWCVSAEAIYDEYGFRRYFDPLDITWERSIYYRDQFAPGHVPMTGFGYYANLVYTGDCFTGVLGYGDYFPEQIGDWRQDATNHRGLLKGTWSMTQHLDAYSIVIVETDVPNAQAGRDRKGWALWCGFQYRL